MVSWSELRRSDIVSYRRYWLDRCLTANVHQMTGIVLDIGGKKERKRGRFRPPECFVRYWWYLNVTPETYPDILADAGTIPLPDGCVDCIICTEVLEHLPHPEACVSEIYRLLRPGGVLIASVPFLYPVHADPYDFQRFTEDGLRALCRSFTSIQIERMGGFLGTLGMLLELGLSELSGWRLLHRITRRVFIEMARLLYWLDDRNIHREPARWRKFTTGYFLIAKR